MSLEWYEGMSPYDAFPMDFAQRVKDTGDCWEWMGSCHPDGRPQYRYNGGRHAEVYVYRLFHEELPPKVKTVQVCENILCVHPEHIIVNKAAVGRMLKIKGLSVIEGECWLWHGNHDKGTPRVAAVGDTTGWMSVRRFVYAMEHGLDYQDVPPMIEPNCGNVMCVSYKHLQPQSDPDEPRVRNHDKERVPCSRGHIGGLYRGMNNKVAGCYICNRDDAEVWLEKTKYDFLERWS